MSMSGAFLGGLDPAGWACSEDGEIKNEEPQCKEDEDDGAYFKHSQSLEAEDVLRMKVVAGGGASVGIAAEGYDVERHVETAKSIAEVELNGGMTLIRSVITQDREDHIHPDHLTEHIPKTLPFNLALRISKDGNVPQIQFNDDAVWHDFAPDRAAVKAGPWFPFLRLFNGDRLSDHCVHRPKPTKSAGKTSKAPAAASSADAVSADGAGAGAAVGKDEESAPPPQNKARHDEGGGSK